MKFYKLKTNEDIFKFSELIFDNDLNLINESKIKLVNFLKEYLEEINCKDNKEFISIISEQLKLDNQLRIGNTIDIYTTNKKIYQMCYLEENTVDKDLHKESFNFLGTIINSKRKIIKGDIFIFSNSLLTTNIQEKANTIDYITQTDTNIDEIIELILCNYYFKGLYFDGNKTGKFLFDNNLKIISPNEYKDIILSELSFKRSDLLNFSIDVFFDTNGDKIKEKYNNKLSLFYLENMNNRIFVALKSESEKKYDSILNDYINNIMTIYDKYCFDDSEINVPKELKFYDYQSNDKYTNKYIVFDNLYSKIVLR
jgi:hypothetical protein